MTRADEGEGRYTVVYIGDPVGNRVLNGEPAVGRAVGVMLGDLIERAAQAEAEVARLRERVATLEAALQPIADWSERLDREFSDHSDDIIAGGLPDTFVTFGQLRAARTALEAPHADN